MKEMFTIYDNKAEIFQEPIFQIDEKEFEANLRMSLQEEDEKTINLAEYEIFYLGKYDEQTGKMDLLDNPRHLYNCAKYKNVKLSEAV